MTEESTNLTYILIGKKTEIARFIFEETFHKRFKKDLWFLQSWGLSRRPPPPDRRRTRAHPQQAQAGIYPDQCRGLGLFKSY
jgi:hypothetical protein